MMMNAQIDQEDNKKDDTTPAVKYEEDFTGKWSTSGKRILVHVDCIQYSDFVKNRSLCCLDFRITSQEHFVWCLLKCFVFIVSSVQMYSGGGGVLWLSRRYAATSAAASADASTDISL